MQQLPSIKLYHHIPYARLRPLIQRFFIVEATNAHRDQHLPSTGFHLIFRYQGTCQIDNHLLAPDMAVTGLWDTVRNHTHSHDHAIVAVAFAPLGAAMFLPQALDEFANTTVDLRDVFTRTAELDRLHDGLLQAATHRERFRLVESFLQSYLNETRYDALIDNAIRLIGHTQGQIAITDLAHHLGLSQSTLERRFRQLVGTSPSRFAAYVRLQHVLHLKKTAANLTALAHQAGYYDQSHFIKEFKRMTGTTPTAFWR